MYDVIINADDCGKNKLIDSCIEKCLINNKITSTTVIANLDDIEGAKSLYTKYHKQASFGFHLNLTEGCPVTDSQILRDIGFFKEEDGVIRLNAQPFRRKFLSRTIRSEIYKEAYAQVQILLDNGFTVSHIDGHHFIHQAIFMIPILPKLCKNAKITKVRNYRNYMPLSIDRITRNCWSKLIKANNRDLLFTDFMTSFESFYKTTNNGLMFIKDNETIELMCHPGGRYTEEERLINTLECEQYFHCNLKNFNQFSK